MNIIGGKAIGRTLVLTRCKCIFYNSDTEAMEESEFIIAGKLSKSSAQSKLRNAYKDETIIVTSVDHVTSYYSVPLADFLELAMDNKEIVQ